MKSYSLLHKEWSENSEGIYIPQMQVMQKEPCGSLSVNKVMVSYQHIRETLENGSQETEQQS